MELPLITALTFIILFTFGGITGTFLRCIGIDYYFHDSYYVVAHFHYVMSIASSLGGFIGLNSVLTCYSRLSSLNMDLYALRLLIFFHSNLTFIPMHVLGLNAIPRRYIKYSVGLNCSNYVASLGACYSMFTGRMTYLTLFMRLLLFLFL